MATSTYLVTLSVFFGTFVFIFGMKYFATVTAARARIANDDAYRSLAEKAVTAQSESQAAVSAMQAELSKVSATLANVEKILKQVE